MPEVKKPGSMSIRAERAEVTRRRIADAARRLFARDGYGATTLVEIAREAEVAVQTVYAVYGSKPAILRRLREAIAHDADADVLFDEAVKETATERKLQLFARSIRIRWERGHDVVAASEDAARADPTVKREVERVLAQRRAGIARLARTIPQQDARRVAALLDALTLPAVYRELVEVHGWSPDHFEIWLSRTLRDELRRS